MEYVTSTDGTEIAFDSGGSGPPVVLVHGTGSNHACWEGVRDILEDEYTIYAMDRRGRGASGDADEYHIEREFEDIATLVESIDEPVNLVGHSYGSLTSLGASTLVTDSLRRMVLYEPPLWTPNKNLAPEDALETMDRQIEEGDDEGVVETFFIDVAHSEDRLEYYRTLDTWKHRLDAAPTIAREVRGTSIYRPGAGDFEHVETPTRVMMGSETGGHLPAGTRAAYEFLPNGELLELGGLDHSAIYSAPGRFAEAAREFLQRE